MSDEGRLVAGRYRVQRRIGSGAMGVVWECVDERLQRTVAVKQLVMQPGLDAAEAEEARQRAMREGRIAARLQHPHAVSVYDVAEEEGQPVLVMEYLPSTSLASMMSEHGPLPPREVARIGAQVADALGAAHAVGVVHRDIKPGNVLLGEDGTVKITDFGISRAQGDISVTQTGMLAGTPAYLSPDVACGKEPSGASDVFSLGATLYAAVEGHPPFGQSENTLALLHAVAAGKVEPPQQAGPMTDPLMAMLQANNEDRPDMAQVRQMLQTVSEGQAVTSVPSRPVPIQPAMSPGTAAATEATPTNGDGGTVVAGSSQEDDLYSGGDTRAANAYLGSDTRADAAVNKRRGKGPLVAAGVLLVAAVAAGILVVTSLLGNDGEGDRVTPAGGETSSELAPTSTTTTERTTSEPQWGEYTEDEDYYETTQQQETTEEEETSTSTSEPETSESETSTPTSGSEDTDTTTTTTEPDTSTSDVADEQTDSLNDTSSGTE